MCRQWAIADVIEWYESVPADVINQWIAYDRVEPIGIEWEQHASIMAMLDSLFAATVNPHLEESSRIEARKPSEFLPRGYIDQRKEDKKTKRQILEQQLQLLAKAFGG